MSTKKHIFILYFFTTLYVPVPTTFKAPFFSNDNFSLITKGAVVAVKAILTKGERERAVGNETTAQARSASEKRLDYYITVASLWFVLN